MKANRNIQGGDVEKPGNTWGQLGSMFGSNADEEFTGMEHKSSFQRKMHKLLW